MKLRMLAAVLFVTPVQAQPPPGDASSWYVLIGKHSAPWSLCYANIVAEKFKNGTYVEADAAESAKRDEDVQCKLKPPTDFEKLIQEECDKAQKSAEQARERFQNGVPAHSADPWSDPDLRAIGVCTKVPPPRYVGGGGGCNNALWNLERSHVLTVTRRLGPYPTADRAADELRADGWQTGTNPSSGSPIWFKRGGCEKAS